MHLILALAALVANLPIVVAGAVIVALTLHFWLRYPVRGALLIVSGRSRFALPVEGRFNLAAGEGTRIGYFWIEFVFSDRPNSRFLVIRDQITEPDWRWLCLILREGV